VLEREGEGWRLAWDPQRDPFPVLIGGEGWASELTAPEALALHKALEALVAQHRSLADTLMEEESLCLDYQGSLGRASGPSNMADGSLWLTLEGDRWGWTLRILLNPAPGLRGVEGFWSRGAAVTFAQTYIQLMPSNP
jgi:hypothetical protein